MEEVKEPQNLMSGILSEMNRVRDLIKRYDELPGGVGFFGSMIMKQSIKQAEAAISSGNTVDMLVVYSLLKSHEE